MASRNPSASDYPPGPITCCLQCIGKEIKIREDHTWTVSLIICWVSSVIAFLLYVVAFGTVGWARTVSLQVEDGETGPVTRRIGLWQECHSVTGCSYTDSATNSGGFKAAQAFSVLSLACIITGAILTVGYSFFPQSGVKDRMGIGALWTRFITFIMLLLLIPIFAQTWGSKYSSGDNEKHLEYSFILTVVAFCLEAVGVLFTYTDVIILTRNKSKLLQTSVDYGYSNQGFNEGSQSSIHPGSAGISINPDYNRSSVDRLGELIQGHMNAKVAYEHFAQDDQHDQMVQTGPPPPPSLRASRESLFRTPGEIEKRFSGITLAEPEYNSIYGSQSTLTTVTRPEEHPMVVQKGRHNMATAPNTKDRREPKLSVHNGQLHPDQSQQQGQIRPSISLQNIYQGNAPLQISPMGKPITSVSMYNIYDEVNNGLSAFGSHLAIPDAGSMVSEQNLDGHSVASYQQGTPRKNAQASKPAAVSRQLKQQGRQRTPKTKKQFSLSRENLIRELGNEDSVSRVSMTLPQHREEDHGLSQQPDLDVNRYLSRSHQNLNNSMSQLSLASSSRSRENIPENISRSRENISGNRATSPRIHQNQDNLGGAIPELNRFRSQENVTDDVSSISRTAKSQQNPSDNMPRSQENLAANIPVSVRSSSQHNLTEDRPRSRSKKNIAGDIPMSQENVPMNVRSKSHQNLAEGVPMSVRSKSHQNLAEGMPKSIRSRSHQNLTQDVPLSIRSRSHQNLAQDAPMSVRSRSQPNLADDTPISVRTRSRENITEGISASSALENINIGHNQDNLRDASKKPHSESTKYRERKPKLAQNTQYPNPLYETPNHQTNNSRDATNINATDEQKEHYAKRSSHPGKVAPPRKRKDRPLAASSENLSGAPLSHAHSTLSLHSVTSMVAGCAETEI